MKPQGPSPARRAASDGFIIVAVLWILGALAVLASIYAVFVVDTATAVASHTDRVRTEALVTAGLELAAYRITAVPQQRPSNGAFSFRSGQASVAVRFQSETARIDLNHAPKELLMGLFASLGATREAESYADRIIGWRSPPAERQDEAAAYRTAGLHYGPRGAAFPHVGELWLVMGLPEAVIERALPHLTVYSTQPQVSILDASAQVLAALPGMSPERLHAVLAEREATPQDAQRLLSVLGPAQTHATAEPGKAVRVTVRTALDNGRRMRSDVVIFVHEEDSEPYRILSWNDDVDEPAGGERGGAERGGAERARAGAR
jgi:general secretion pathway protein K